MRILYHAIVELDLPDGHALHTIEVCESLAGAGHEVVLISPRSRYRPRSPRFRLAPVRFFGFTGLRLAPYRLLSFLRASEEIHRFRPHVIIDKSTPFLLDLSFLAPRFDIPLVVELNGIYPFDEVPFNRMMYRGLRRAARTCRMTFFGVSPSLGKIVGRRIGIGPIPFVHFENGASPGLFRPDGPSLRERLGVDPSCFLAGFAGADNPDYDFPAMLCGAAIALGRGLDIRLLFGGSRHLHDRIRRIDEKIGLGPRVIYQDYLNRSDVPLLIRAFDAGLVVWKNEIAHMGPTALKLKEMLLSGVPAITNLPDCWYDWPLAPAIHPLRWVTPESVAVVIEEIAADRPAARARALRGGDLVRERYSWDAVGRSYGEKLAAVIAADDTRPAGDHAARRAGSCR
jgi:glycosyltransferase involved in cell wall biosynthesis